MKVLRITFSLSALLFLLASTAVAGSVTQDAPTTTIEEMLPHQAPVVSTQINTAGPAYLNQTPATPWGGLVVIPALALVFLFPVIVVKYFPEIIGPQPLRAQP